MRNVKLTLQYDGSNYAGWQVQNNAMTVQELVESALCTVLREEVRVAAASRTDSGVHALGQVAAFKTRNSFAAEKLHRSLNGILPSDIRVTEVAEVGDDFVPRYASEKSYRYAISCGEFVSPFQVRYSWHVREPLDFDAIRAAARPLLGEHDFSSFVASGGGEKTHVRNVFGIEFGRGGIVGTCTDEDNVYHLDVVADGFLYKMVRNIVGTLVEVGRGKITLEDVRDILNAKDRTKAGPTAPARGLCLVSVKY